MEISKTKLLEMLRANLNAPEFILKKVFVIPRRYPKVPRLIRNCLVIYQDNIPLHENSGYNFEECVIITNQELIVSSSCDCILNSNPLILLNEIMSTTALSEPLGIDENALKYRQGVYERLLIDKGTVLNIGQKCTIGCTGDVIEWKDQVPHQILSIGAVKLGRNVVIGNNVIIYRGLTALTVIEDNVVIGDNVIIHHDSHITKGSIIKPFSEI